MSEIEELIEKLDGLYAKATPGCFPGGEWLADGDAIYISAEGKMLIDDLWEQDADLIIALHNAYPRLRDALRQAEAEVADWKDGYRRVIMEDCDSRETAEQHCTCVPHLRRRIAELEHERDAAREEAARLREAQRWIPVSERLPESEYPEDGESISVQGFCNAGIWDGVLSPIYYIYRTGHWYFGQSRLDTVTHWRPLPEPPALPPAAQDKTE